MARASGRMLRTDLPLRSSIVGWSAAALFSILTCSGRTRAGPQVQVPVFRASRPHRQPAEVVKGNGNCRACLLYTASVRGGISIIFCTPSAKKRACLARQRAARRKNRRAKYHIGFLKESAFCKQNKISINTPEEEKSRSMSVSIPELVAYLVPVAKIRFVPQNIISML